jgi:ribonuclease HII
VPTLEFEQSICEETGLSRVTGLDEAGRGAIAGPVVAAAVLLPFGEPVKLAALEGVNDSKQLTARRRESLFQIVVDNVVSYGIASSSALEIDEIGIIPATKRAMLAALAQLSPRAQCLLIDGRLRLMNCALPQWSLVRGDSKSLSIAAASILAKVSRDQMMIDLDSRLPEYGFAQHKGYGTRKHLAALAVHGPTRIHRRSFAPLRHSLI